MALGVLVYDGVCCNLMAVLLVGVRSLLTGVQESRCDFFVVFELKVFYFYKTID
jgi:hypothetical protein